MTEENGKRKRRTRRTSRKRAPAKKAPKPPPAKKKPRGKKKRSSKHAELLESGLDPWLQQPKESNQAYQAFTAYRDLQAHERSLEGARATVKKSITLIEGWSARWSWLARCREWDIDQEQALLEANRAEVIKMRMTQASGAALIGRAATGPSRALVQLMEDDPNVLIEAIKDEKGVVMYSRLVELFHLAMDAARIFPLVADVERLARGEPSQITDHTHRITTGARGAKGGELDMTSPETQRKALDLMNELHGITMPKPKQLKASKEIVVKPNGKRGR